jgi:hypothetical protein
MGVPFPMVGSKGLLKHWRGQRASHKHFTINFGNGRYLAPCNILGGQVPKDEQREKSGIILSHYKYITPFVYNTSIC